MLAILVVMPQPNIRDGVKRSTWEEVIISEHVQRKIHRMNLLPILAGLTLSKNSLDMFMKLTFFLCFISILFCNCSNSRIETVEIGELENVRLIRELKLDLDNEVSSLNLNFIAFDQYNDEILILPANVNKIKRYSPATGGFLGEIKLEKEGPNGVGGVSMFNFSIQPISKELILLYADWHEVLYIVNRSGQIQRKIKLKDYEGELAIVNHFSKIIYNKNELLIPTVSGLQNGENKYLYYKIDLLKNKLAKLIPAPAAHMETASNLFEVYERSNTMGNNGELLTLFPYVDSIYVWSKEKSYSIPLNSGILDENIYPKNLDIYKQKIDEFGELDYRETFSKFLNITYIPSKEQYMINYIVGEKNIDSKKYPIGLLILDKEFKIIAQTERDKDFSQYFLVRDDQILIGNLGKTKSEDELIFDVLALP